MPDLSPILLDVKEAASFIGVSVSTLKEWRAEGAGPRFRPIGARVLYHVDDLRNWAESLPASQSVAEAKHLRAS